MTAAFGDLTGLAVRGRAGRVLCVLALVLPVPLFAALGLSLPLPATVERIAAKLVPFGDSTRVTASADGSITRAPGETRAREEGGALVPRASGETRRETRAGHRTVATSSNVVRPGPRTGDDGNDVGATAPAAETERSPAPTPSQQTDDDPRAAPSSGGVSSGGSDPGAGGGGSDPGGGGGGSDPGGGGGGSNPVPTQPVETVTNTASSAVETVTTAVTEVTKPVDETTKETVGGIKLP